MKNRNSYLRLLSLTQATPTYVNKDINPRLTETNAEANPLMVGRNLKLFNLLFFQVLIIIITGVKRKYTKEGDSKGQMVTSDTPPPPPRGESALPGRHR